MKKTMYTMSFLILTVSFLGSLQVNATPYEEWVKPSDFQEAHQLTLENNETFMKRIEQFKIKSSNELCGSDLKRVLKVVTQKGFVKNLIFRFYFRRTHDEAQEYVLARLSPEYIDVTVENSKTRIYTLLSPSLNYLEIITDRVRISYNVSISCE